MTPLALCCELTDAGFTLRLDAGRLMASPASKLTAEQRAAIAAHKPDLIRCLLPWRTTHCGQPAALLEVDAEGVAWYSTWRLVEPGPLHVPCMVRESFLNDTIPFE